MLIRVIIFKCLIIYLHFDHFLCMRMIDDRVFCSHFFKRKILVINIIIK
jgi:hypothetical protein